VSANHQFQGGNHNEIQTASGTRCDGLRRGCDSRGGVRVLFNPASPDIGPFPTDVLTVADPAQKTGLRVNLPKPDCDVEPSTCLEITAVNQLDGFSIEPRLRIRFSGLINPDTLRDGIFLVWLDDLTNEEYGLQPFSSVTPINSVSYDPATNTAFAEPDDILSQHRRYALVVTSAVRDTKGDPSSPIRHSSAASASREDTVTGLPARSAASRFNSGLGTRSSAVQYSPP